jgi:SAM-dependent methyltransferase
MIHPWESEYRNPQFITLGTEPLADVRDFIKWIQKTKRKESSLVETSESLSSPLSEWTVLDAGCGNGKNLKYLVDNYCEKGIGYDISATSINLAKKLSGNLGIKYKIQSIGEVLPLPDESVDLVIDATSSHALTKKERAVFLNEISRVMKTGSYYFLRTLALEGDANAKELIKNFPGKEPNTYILPKTKMFERVFSKADIENDFKEFEILYCNKKTGYQRWGNQNYKRNYWVVYLQKK